MLTIRIVVSVEMGKMLGLEKIVMRSGVDFLWRGEKEGGVRAFRRNPTLAFWSEELVWIMVL